MAQQAKDRFIKQTSKGQISEKFVMIYERLLRGEDPSSSSSSFWDELFLLKVNVEYLDEALNNMSVQVLVDVKETINLVFHKCCEALCGGHPIRIINALQTLCALVRFIFRKAPEGGVDGFDVIDVLIGFNGADVEMQSLVSQLSTFLTGKTAVSIKNLALKLLLVLVTATNNVSQNVMLEYLMINSVFEAIVAIFSSPAARQEHGFDAMMLLTMLVNYRKYEAANPYILRLSVLDDEVALNGLGVVLSSALTEWNRQYVATKEAETPQGGLLWQLANYVSGMFTSSEEKPKTVQINDSVLLALYEAVHLNRNFITVLTQTHSPDHLPSPGKSQGNTPAVEQTNAMHLGSSTDTVVASQSQEMQSYPVNLLGTFLTYTSIAMQHAATTDEGATSRHARLCLIILTCIVEDQYANSFVHDSNMTFKVNLQRTTMRHRRIASGPTSGQCLACTVLDLMVETLLSHLRRNLPMDLYARCLGIIHRLLCYQKRCRVRLMYNWQELWTALISIVKFLVSNEVELIPKCNVFVLAIQVINLFNLFITYGDTFLPSPTSYDELYYEIVRMHHIFENLYAMALRHSTSGGQWKAASNHVANDLVNIRAIINHFATKIDSWAATRKISSLTESQVLEVVRANYDTLTLKLQDNLDHYMKYSEKPHETSFFTQLMRSLTLQFRQLITLHNLAQMSVIQELSTII
ncbi:armadillo-like helical domain-containing protein 3 [Corticium candelabrum]|uniref:armadillo-like helical domain-containing protein 3 n=1 Tax=Corticium candelabrum TaxID=121492 RepID=UPI002E254980|nr:armadillo-like helical domain-containing protein 3 [Corticium candelabrum]